MLSSFLEASDWQKIQNLFARIIGTNLALLDASGRFLTQPSFVTASCSEIALPLDSSSAHFHDCLSSIVRKGVEKGKSFFCSHGLHFLGFKINLKGESHGTLVLGPMLLGKREADEAYRNLCRELKIQEENFLDRVREIKLFSHATISTAVDLLQEITGSFLDFASQNHDLKRLVSGILPAGSKRTEEFSPDFYTSEVADSLMDIALEVVKGDSGSVLLFDKGEQHFYIKTSRGIAPEIIKEAHVPLKDGVVGWVAAREKPLLIQKDTPPEGLAGRLNRPEIHASFVVPMSFQNQTLGVFCINTKSPNKKFTEKSLQLLDRLSKLAGVAFGRHAADKSV